MTQARWAGAGAGPRFVFISSGVAAGIGASFRCPFTGIMFAFEEFSSFWTVETARHAPAPRLAGRLETARHASKGTQVC